MIILSISCDGKADKDLLEKLEKLPEVTSREDIYA